EVGCAAIDKGANQPNKFIDPKSSESSLPKYSDGARDDLMQMQYLRALSEFWGADENNPTGSYGAPMVATDRMFVWAWDARPYPFFPGNSDVWSDGENYARGHWLNGRVSARALSSVIKTICAEAGVTDVDVSRVYGLVRGFALEGGENARAALQPLMLAHGVDAIEKDGTLVFRQRDGRPGLLLTRDDLADGESGALVSRHRLPEAESSGRVRLAFVEADGDYEVRATEGIFPDEATTGVAQSELAMSLTQGEAGNTVERWLAESRVARDAASFAVPPSSEIEAGDVIEFEGDSFRVDRIEDAGVKQVEAVRVERGLYRPASSPEVLIASKPVAVALPVWGEIMDLPLLTGNEISGAPWGVASADPWPGGVAVYSALDDTSWRFETVLDRKAVMGQTLTDLPRAEAGVWDRGMALEVKFLHGALSSIDEGTLFAGGNVALIGVPGGDDWEVFQFRDAELTAPGTWALSHRLRGQRGTDGVMPLAWPAGATVIVFDAALSQIDMSPELFGLPRKYRIGPANKAVDHASFIEFEKTITGAALRPYQPAHLRAVSEGGDIAFHWTRRTRTSGDAWGAGDVPLGETSEAYLLRVTSGGVVRREISLSAPNWTYSSADQAADGVSAPFDVEVAQVSDLFGPGIFVRIVING
ncbi:MAG: host specificity protein, partial [Silicimonas sp.]|nr:host specificity protein [Silicimonas sp.]